MMGQSHLRMGQEICEGPSAEVDEVRHRHSPNSSAVKGAMSRSGSGGGSSGWVRERLVWGATKNRELSA